MEKKQSLAWPCHPHEPLFYTPADQSIANPPQKGTGPLPIIKYFLFSARYHEQRSIDSINMEMKK